MARIRKDTKWWVTAVVLCVVWRIVGHVLTPTEVHIARNAAAVRTAELNYAYIAPLVTLSLGIVLVVGTLAFCGIAVSGVLWAYNRAASVVPVEGVFPLVRRQDYINYNVAPTTTPAVPLLQHSNVTTPPVVVPQQSLRCDSLDNLVVGYDYDSGEEVSVSLEGLMHTLCVGSSGWGKSTWLRALLYQIAQANDPIHMAAIDCYGSALNVLKGWNKLMFPLARTVPQAESVLDAVLSEIERRRVLYEEHIIAEKLSEYNEVASEPLAPWLCIIDEGTSLLNDSGIGNPLRRIVQTARQYGVYTILLGQNANYDVVATQTRGQFATKICFRVPPSSSQAVLNNNCASEIDQVGVAYAELSGKPLRKMRAPYIGKREFFDTLTRGDVPSLPQSDDERVRELHKQGMSLSKIAQEVYKCPSGTAFYKVKGILGIE